MHGGELSCDHVKVIWMTGKELGVVLGGFDQDEFAGFDKFGCSVVDFWACVPEFLGQLENGIEG